MASVSKDYIIYSLNLNYCITFFNDFVGLWLLLTNFKMFFSQFKSRKFRIIEYVIIQTTSNIINE